MQDRTVSTEIKLNYLQKSLPSDIFFLWKRDEIIGGQLIETLLKRRYIRGRTISIATKLNYLQKFRYFFFCLWKQAVI